MKPILEVNENCVDETDHFVLGNNHIMVSPPTGEDYWTLRVKLCKDQAVLGFPKMGSIGVGMALEENWDTNLPLWNSRSPEENAERIARHIKCNKKYKSITIKMIEDAIILIDKGARDYGFVK